MPQQLQLLEIAPFQITLENAQLSLILSDNNAESDFAIKHRGDALLSDYKILTLIDFK